MATLIPWVGRSAWQGAMKDGSPHQPNEESLCLCLTMMQELLQHGFAFRAETLMPLLSAPEPPSAVYETIEEAAMQSEPGVPCVVGYACPRDQTGREVVPEELHSAGARAEPLPAPVVQRAREAGPWHRIAALCKDIMRRCITADWTSGTLASRANPEAGASTRAPVNGALMQAAADLMAQLLENRLVDIAVLGLTGEGDPGFVADSLLGVPDARVRGRMAELFLVALCQHEERLEAELRAPDSVPSSTGGLPVAALREKFVAFLLSLPLPFWQWPCEQEGSLDLCQTFFTLLGQLLCGTSDGRLAKLVLPVEWASELFLREVDWLARALQGSRLSAAAVEAALPLLEGHLAFLQSVALQAPSEVKQRASLDHGLVQRLLEEALFPTALQLDPRVSVGSCEPLLHRSASRRLALQAILALAAGCPEVAFAVSAWLEAHVVSSIATTTVDWDPVQKPRAAKVGLRNAGATCYMNSILQQLFLHPLACNCVLALPESLEVAFAQTVGDATASGQVPRMGWQCERLGIVPSSP
jgi:hypothetical protein